MGRRFLAGLIAAGLITACSSTRGDGEGEATETSSSSAPSSSDAPATSAPPVETVPPPTTPPAPTTPPRPTITRAHWAALDDQLSVRLMSGGDYAASWAVAIDGEVVHTGAIGDRVPALPPPATTTTTVAATTTTPSTTSTTTTTSSTTSTTTTTVPSRSSTTTPSRRSTTSSSTPTTTSTRRTTTTSPPPTTRATTTVAPTTTLADVTVEADDKFRVASLSKVITATVVLQLVQDGELTLDEPITPVLAVALGVTIADPAVATITVRHLLAHTSGFGTYENTFFRGGVDSCPEAAQRGLTESVSTPPGTTYHYSNMNYCLLGLLIEHVTGDDYEDVAHDRLLRPLGIEGMRLAGTFDPRPGEVQHPSSPFRNYMETLGAAGAWVASAADVVRIVDALDPAKPGWHPLPDDVMRVMRLASDGVQYSNIAERWYGLGLIVWADGSWGHTGTIENTHAMVLNRPDGVTWSILVSGEHPSQSGRLRDIFDQAVEAAGVPLVAP